METVLQCLSCFPLQPSQDWLGLCPAFPGHSPLLCLHLLSGPSALLWPARPAVTLPTRRPRAAPAQPVLYPLGFQNAHWSCWTATPFLWLQQDCPHLSLCSRSHCHYRVCWSSGWLPPGFPVGRWGPEDALLLTRKLRGQVGSLTPGRSAKMGCLTCSR